MGRGEGLDLRIRAMFNCLMPDNPRALAVADVKPWGGLVPGVECPPPPRSFPFPFPFLFVLS